MGLDMYLHRKTYVKNWYFMKPAERHDITVARGGSVRTDIKPERIAYIVEEVAYWRKANAIHQWFVNECQGGEDDCTEHYVDKEKLQELVDLCKKVLASVETVEGKVREGTSYTPDGQGGAKVVEHSRTGTVVAQQGIAKALLPTASGFFFGSTDYDEYYLDDVQSTIKMIEPLLSEKDADQDFYYRSSW